MFDKLYEFDITIFRIINVDLANPHLDLFWRTITQLHKIEWFIYGVVPLLIAIGFYIYRWQIIKPIVVLAIAIALSDGIAYRIIKKSVERERPFQNQEISSWVRKVGEAHGSSFPSNHAANVFAGAMILSWYFPGGKLLLFTIASVIAISRIALGVHYPSDVFAGMWLGLIIGFLMRAFVLNQSRGMIMRGPVSDRDDDSSSWRTRTGRTL